MAVEDVYLVIRRKMTTIQINMKESTTVLQVKKMIEGILKVPPSDQQLCNMESNIVMDQDHATLTFYNLNPQTARAHTPATIGLCFRDQGSGKFEALDITPYSTPPEIPEVMRCQENSASSAAAQESAMAQ